jgi:tetratricopeptide (TPR) repeat protein
MDMDETLKQAYHEIIYELLINPKASALVIKKSVHLVDENFIEVLGEMSTLLAERNCPEDAELLLKLHQQLQEADSLETWLAEHLPRPAAAKKRTLSPQQQKEKAEQLFHSGTQHFKANEYTEAIQVWQQALPLYQGSGEIKAGINCLGKLGNLYQTLGQYQQAISVHQRALGLSKKIKYRRGEASTLNSLGQVCTLLGQYDRAIACYQDSLEISQKINFRTAEIQGLNYLGQVYYALGQYQQALEYHQQALSLAKQRDLGFAQAYSLSSLGHTYAALQNTEQAIHFYQEALTLFQQGNYPFPQASCLRNLGLVHQRQGNIEQAFSYINSYLDFAKTLNYQVAEANAYLDLAELNILQGEYEEAINRCHQSLEIRQSLKDVQGEAKILNCLGRIYQLSQQSDQALEVLQKSLDLAVPQLFPQESFKAAQQLGNIATTLEDWELAIQAYLQAIQVLEQQNISFTVSSEAEGINRIDRQVYSQLIEIYIQLHQLEKAIEIVERFRSYQFVQAFSDSQLLVSDEIAEDLELYQRLQRQMNALHFRRQSDELKPLSTSGLNLNSYAGLQVEATALTVLEAETKKIWQRLQESDPVLAAKLRVVPLSFSEIQNRIDNQNSAILSLFISQNQINLFVITADQIRLHPCAEGEVEAFMNGLENSWFKPRMNNTLKWREQMSESLLKLAQSIKLSQLITEMLQQIQELIIIPDLSLSLLPFAALPVLIEDQPGYLGDLFDLRMLPNIQLCSTLPSTPSIDTPTFGVITHSKISHILDQYTCQKITDIRQEKETDYLDLNQVNVDQFKTWMQQINALHTSYPVQSDTQQIAKTQWQCSDESLTLEQIMSWDISKLSEIFLSQDKMQFTPSSLLNHSIHPWAYLLYCGVNTVISPLWNGDGIANLVFNLLYYQNRQTVSAKSALKTAMNQLRNLTVEDFKTNYQPDLEEFILSQQTTENQQQINDLRTSIAMLSQKYHPFASPYYWASYVLQG